MQALTYAQIEAATKEGPEAVAKLLYGAGVELAGLSKDLRRKLRASPEALAALADANVDALRMLADSDAAAPATLDALKREPGETDASYSERLRLLGRSRPTDTTQSAPPAKDPPPLPTVAKRDDRSR